MQVVFLFIDNRTIPVTTAGEGDPQYRLTEDLTSYLNCRVRSRNKNLFTADQVIQSIRDDQKLLFFFLLFIES